jgi:hypothetical protein
MLFVVFRSICKPAFSGSHANIWQTQSRCHVPSPCPRHSLQSHLGIACAHRLCVFATARPAKKGLTKKKGDYRAKKDIQCLSMYMRMDINMCMSMCMCISMGRVYVSCKGNGCGYVHVHVHGGMRMCCARGTCVYVHAHACVYANVYVHGHMHVHVYVQV